jgi:hypothetical protein
MMEPVTLDEVFDLLPIIAYRGWKAFPPYGCIRSHDLVKCPLNELCRELGMTEDEFDATISSHIRYFIIASADKFGGDTTRLMAALGMT